MPPEATGAILADGPAPSRSGGDEPVTDAAASRDRATTGEPLVPVPAGDPGPQPGDDRIWTVPNALSVLRLLGVPLFLWLVLGPERDGWAVIVLMVGGATDWLDGKIARAFNQYSSLGRLLDPAADRLYIFATLLALTLRDIIPWWLTALLVGRDVVLAALLPVIRHYRYEPLQVHFIGKAATFNLLYALPLILLGDGDNTLADICRPIGWAFTIWGTTLYYWAAVMYVMQVREMVAEGRATTRATGDRPTT